MDYAAACVKRLLRTGKSARAGAEPTQELIGHVEMLIRMLHPDKLRDEPRDEHILITKQWIDAPSTKAQKPGIVRCLRRLKTNEALIAIAKGQCDTPETWRLFQRVRCASPALLKTFGMFGFHVRALVNNSGVADLQTCGDLSLERAAAFCIERRSTAATLRAQMLAFTGFQHGADRLRDEMNSLERMRERYRRLDTGKRAGGHNSQDYLKLRFLFGVDPVDASTLPVAEIEGRFVARTPAPRDHFSFKLFVAELHERARGDAVRELQIRLDKRLTLITHFQRVGLLSPWHAQALEDILRALSEQQTRTSYPEQRKQRIKAMVGSQVAFLKRHAALAYQA